ncbi:MAG: site-specific integrase [Thermoguttaceae bacterium]
MCRFSGLRPSDAITLTWAGVNFPESRLVVTAPKLAHHASKGVRVVPITEDFRQYLEDVLDLTGDTPFVFPEELRKRAEGESGMGGLNLRTQLAKIIKRAGVACWGKPFQNMRASYESDMADRLPLAMAAKLTGNSSMVAMRHYVDVTDATFEAAKAIRLVEPKASPAGQVLSVQKRERFVSEMPRNGKNDTFCKSSKTLELPVSTTRCRLSQTPHHARQESNLQPAD